MRGFYSLQFRAQCQQYQPPAITQAHSMPAEVRAGTPGSDSAPWSVVLELAAPQHEARWGARTGHVREERHLQFERFEAPCWSESLS